MYPCHGEIEDVIAGLGGRFDPDQPDSIFSASLNGALDTATRIVGGARKNMNTQWANRPLDVTFVRNHDVNAFATKGERADHIVITLGAVQAIFGTMCALMASPSFLPEIGDVSKEEELQGPFPHGFPPMPLLQGNLPPDPSAVYHPRDARMAFALQLSEDALQFLVLHELGHILGGHLEVREARGLSPKLFEIGQYNSGPIGPELRQVLEYDADMFATHAQSFLAMQPEVAELLQNTFEWSNVSPEDAGVIMYTVAVSVLFRLLEADGPAPQAEPEIEYPHPAVRSNLVISKGLTLAHDAAP